MAITNYLMQMTKYVGLTLFLYACGDTQTSIINTEFECKTKARNLTTVSLIGETREDFCIKYRPELIENLENCLNESNSGLYVCEMVDRNGEKLDDSGFGRICLNNIEGGRTRVDNGAGLACGQLTLQ